MSIDTRRLSGTADVCAASRLFRDAYAEAPWNEAWSLSTANDRLQELAEMPGRIAVGAFVDDILAGITLGFTQSNVNGKALYIAEVVVDPPFQGRGIGGRLLETMRQEAIAEGHLGAWLVTRGEGRTAEFYRKMNFDEALALRLFRTDYIV